MISADASTAGYVAARQAVAWVDLSDHGWLRVTGSTRLDFLQRLSTNDFRKLITGGGLPTVLANAAGRVIALLLAYAAEDALYLRTPPGRAIALAAYLNNLIFWNDRVEVADLTPQTAQWGLFGPQAADALSRLTGIALDDLPPYGWRSGQIEGRMAVTVCRGGAMETPDWTVVTAADASVRAALAAIGPGLSRDQVEILRVEKGIPAWGHELSDQVTPLEAGLGAAVAENKGCYTGQEVIARQSNYDKVTRRLVGLVLPDEAIGLDLNGAAIAGGSGRGGFVGTAVWSPTQSRAIALAIVPRGLAEPGTDVTIKLGDVEVVGRVTGLPFGANE
jgi:folate-binding protein YgfZ